MKIGFDARLINETGVGRYIQNLLPLLIKSNKKHRWVVIIRKSERQDLDKIIPKSENIEVIEFNYRWHSFLEQLLLPFILYRKKLDIFHTPYINVPVFYFKRKAVTIHDITVLDVNTGKASTKNILFYKLKRLGYKIALKSALRSKIIFVVTNSVKQDILSKFPKTDQSKIIVTYNGFTKLTARKNKNFESHVKSLTPYFLYVGNAHPHKNLDFLVDSLDTFFTKIPKFKIVLAGRSDYFMKRLEQKVNRLKTKQNFVFIASPNDSELAHLYKNSKAVILPSLKEGFGLQILEAMDKGSLILCSRIAAYKEVAGSSATYFDPKSSLSFMIALGKVLKINGSKKASITKHYPQKIKRYSWQANAKVVMQSYTGVEGSGKQIISKSYN
jgi:glycosyltransferase involved in cell wall biosynthesis